MLTFTRRLRSSLSYANVIATLALVVALGGTAWAAGITGAGIQDGSVTSADIKDSTLKSVDYGLGSVQGSDILNGTIGSSDLAASTKKVLQPVSTSFSGNGANNLTEGGAYTLVAASGLLPTAETSVVAIADVRIIGAAFDPVTRCRWHVNNVEASGSGETTVSAAVGDRVSMNVYGTFTLPANEPSTVAVYCKVDTDETGAAPVANVDNVQALLFSVSGGGIPLAN